MKREKSALRLTPWREAIGVLEEIMREDNRIIIKLSYSLELPPHLYSSLKSKIGKRIGVLRTMCSYRLRIIADESSGKG